MPETDEPSEGKEEKKKEERIEEEKKRRRGRNVRGGEQSCGAAQREWRRERPFVCWFVCLFLIPGMRVYSLSSPRVNPGVMAGFFFLDRVQLVVSP